MSEFGRLLKSLRIQREITVRKFAEKIQEEASYISKIERGLAPGPVEEYSFRRVLLPISTVFVCEEIFPGKFCRGW